MEKSEHKIAVLAAGDFPTHAVPLRALAEADFVVCCDSAYLHFRQWAAEQSSATKPFVVVGDADSLPADQRLALAESYVSSPDQETNDLTKALTYVASHFDATRTEVSIVGATGKREDHTLGNISLLADYAEQFSFRSLLMLTDHGLFTPVLGRRLFQSFARQQVSLFSLTPGAEVSVGGLQYHIDRRPLDRWWQGTLNAALADTFWVEADRLLVFQTYDPKP